MIRPLAPERSYENQPARATPDRLIYSDGTISFCLLSRIWEPMDIRPGFSESFRRRIEITNPELRDNAEHRRVAHASVGRDKTRTGNG